MAFRRPLTGRPASASSGRVTKLDPPPPVNPFTGKPFGEPAAPQIDERAAAEVAAGQLALATAEAPGATRARLLREAEEHPERFRSPLNPTPEQVARRAVIRRGGRR
jgi:hypothetical protein